MDRVDKVFYNDSSLVISQQQPVAASGWTDDAESRGLAEEKERELIALKQRLKVETHKRMELQFQWHRLEMLVNSADSPWIKLSKLKSILQDNPIDTRNNSESFSETDLSFMRRLKSTFLNLSSNDLRICTLLRQNLSTKEVAQNLGIGSDSANKARYRIRKKLNLTRKDNLVQFILEF